MRFVTAQPFVAPKDVCFWLEGRQERMFRDPSLVRELEREKMVRVQNDPKLLRNGSGYYKFVKRLHSLGLVEFSRENRVMWVCFV